ncbi:PA0069 family radical SAM protein [Mesonia maritima]|uniref:DNA repair photolyase n=1 Tax=Mesonia maritima TaxID=1793873 RepID=A0ABU1K239_9FLAO|nr:PA0069 family radical SAM protein [Mesonia maritima]MDR6299679.1 DNA repair photolyase [Mesonia maritima]
MEKFYQKGRGAQKNVANKFFELEHIQEDEFLEYCHKEGEKAVDDKTHFQEVFPKTFVNKVNSPDVGMGFSANPYQGCEHGCIYCYARNSHEYWGYSAGQDFEQQILVKKNAPQLLEKKLNSKNWQGDTIIFSGNTDCYQPIEKKLQITRKCLEIMLKYKHPTGIITKNALILRDLDILKELAKFNLIRVNISITSLSEETRRILEPRTATIKKRLNVVETLSANNIPVNVMMAPIIPSINSHEIFPLVKKVSELGAISVGYTIVRLNGAIAEIFKDWIEKTMPDRAEKVLHQIEACHGGNLNDSRFGTRMKGEGEFAKQIAQQFTIARQKFLKKTSILPLDNSHFLQLKNPQYKLF